MRFYVQGLPFIYRDGMTLIFRLFFVLEWIFRGPFPGRICFLDLDRFLHGRRRDGVIGMTGLVGHPRGGLDDEPFAGKIAGIGRSSQAAEIDPLAREAVARANNVVGLLFSRGQCGGNFLFQRGRLGDELIEIAKRKRAALPELVGVERMRRRGLKIGSTTGYTRPMLEILLKKAATQGYDPDCSLVPDDVGGGRPLPWMCYEIAVRLKVFPLESFVKVGDTVADTEEGLNAGMWTVGVVRTGNMVGLTQAQFAALFQTKQEMCLQTGRDRLIEAGTHYVIDSVSDFDPVFDEIDARLGRGERP